MSTALKPEAGSAASNRRALLAERLRNASKETRPRPLSFAQQRLWFLDQLEPNSALYNVATAARIEGELDVALFEEAINGVVARHEALRTRFMGVEGIPEQIIEKTLRVGLERIDLTQSSEPELEAKRLVRQEIHKPFDLCAGPPIRATLITLKPREYQFTLILHHIVADEWSVKVFFDEFVLFYDALVRGQTPSLPALPIQYADYAEWQRDWLRGEVLERQLRYWKDKLGTKPPLTELPADHPRKVTPGFHGGILRRSLGATLSRKIQEFCRQNNSTLFMVLVAAFKALVYRYTQQRDIVIGAPIAGRNRYETEQLIGFFVNTLLLRTAWTGDLTFSELVARVRETTLGAYAHQDLPFEKLIEELQPERSLHHMPMAKIMFVLQNAPLEKLSVAGASFRFLEIESDTAKFDLTVVAQESSTGLVLCAEYDLDVFEARTIARLLHHYEVLLEGAVTNPEQRLSTLPLLTDPERHQLLIEWNKTASEYPRHQCIHELFEAQVERTPQAIAVRFGESTITYGELNRRANQLAGYLRQFQIGPDVPVCICVHRSIAMVIGVLGILKAGGAYVPLDVRYPKERLAFMLEDTQSPVLLTEQGLLQRLPLHSGKVICLDADWELIAGEDQRNLPSRTGPENLAYVMYTSGSTGQPKGVAVPHRGVSRLVLNTNYIHLDPSDRIAQVSNFSFDAATFEIWGALLNGAQLVGITRDVALSPHEFAQELKEAGITAMFLTSALFNQLAGEAPGAFSRMRTLIAGGEALDPKWVRAGLKDRPPLRLLNGYGPTENTTFTCCHQIDELPESAASVPIGRPISNTQVYILDPHLNPVPVGVSGELYTSGEGLARGYWNRPQLTAEKFVPNPFSASSGDRYLYRTGDLARYLPDGTIQFLGRMDHQVKIRGFRIELGEIETVLGKHPAVRECVVAVSGKSAADKRLVAYVVTGPSAGPANASELRAFLLEHLPEYMVPAVFVALPKLPLTDNGKIDRAALPEPDDARPELERHYVPPEDEVELRVARIWETVLNVRPVGIQDKFFDLGGHSLLAVRVIAQIEKQFGRKLKLATIFQAPTVQELSAVLRQEIQESSLAEGSSLVQIQPQGTRPPLFLVHGAGGGMFWGYINLARCLGPTQPVYGFQSRGLDGGDELDQLEKIASQYVMDLRRLQPHGPYFLGGYCFGGVVAYEMARQLSAAGEEVRFLALLNCAPPNSRYRKIPWTLLWWGRLLRNLLYWMNYCRKWTATQRRDFIRWKWNLLKKRLGARKTTSGTGSWPVDAGDLVDLAGYTEEQRRIWNAHIKALVSYVPQPYNGRVHLFRSPGHQLWCSFDPDYGWGDLARGGVDVTIVPGAHEKILEEDCVGTLAAKLDKALTGAQAQSTHQLSPEMCRYFEGPKLELPANPKYSRHFLNQAQRTPAAVAVQSCEGALTYEELNSRANRLAHFLQSRGVTQEVLVAVCLERSLDLMVALLGVAKAGGAFLPLDPDYPVKRLGYILDNSHASLVLTQNKFVSLLQSPQSKRPIICLDQPEEQQRILRRSASEPETNAAANDLAYVIYTSGSTGAPKGVEITNRSLLHHNFAIIKAFALEPRDRVLQFAPLSFDISVEEIFPTWLSGGTVVLRSAEAASSAAAFLRYIGQEAITVLNLPTAFWNELVEFMHSSGSSLPGAVRLVVVGGEKVSDQAYLRWKECVGATVTLMNAYGVTEATVTSTIYQARLDEDTLPIGRPIANTSTLILDEQLRPVSPGLSGELYLGGEGVGRGYLNQPQLTKDRFLPNPFAPRIPGERLYRTGDLVRLREDGNLEFLGRIDDQVKIRGCRIELGEIEAALQSHPEIKEAAVIASAGARGNKRLVAYIVWRNSVDLQPGSLIDFLNSRLPEYMIPASFLSLKSLPRTPAGKIDRHALPAPPGSRPALPQQYVAPRTPLEETLAGIWGEVLSISGVGVHDNFFDLGGQSLAAIQVLSRIREHLHTELPMSALFARPTVSLLATHLAEQAKAPGNVTPIFNARELALSSRQRRIWFLETFELQQSACNRALGLILSGRLQVPALKQSLTVLTRSHEALRTVFPAKAGQPAQYISELQDVALPIVDLSNEPEGLRKARAVERLGQVAARPYITAQPLLRAVLFRFEPTEHWLVLILNSIGADARSLRILAGDLVKIYSAFSSKATEPGLKPGRSFSDALQLSTKLSAEQRAADLDYWKRQLEGAPPLLEMPADRPRAEHRSSAGARKELHLDSSLAQRLQELSIRSGCELPAILLSGFAALLHRYTGSTDMVIGYPVPNRTPGDFENEVGPFENEVPLRLDLTGDPSFNELLGRTKRTLAGAVAHAALSFAELVEELHPGRNSSYTPLFQVMFSLEDEVLPLCQAGALAVQGFEAETHTAQVDLALHLRKGTTGSLSGLVDYSTALFDQSRIARLIDHFLNILAALVEAPNQKISQAPILTKPERELLNDWNNTHRDYPRTRTLVDLFVEQVGRTPNATALVSGTERLTYQQLADGAEQIARNLRPLLPGPESLVGICLERSAKTVAAILGTLIAGAAYVPLDPNYPKDRLEFIARDANLRVLLTEGKLLDKLPATNATILNVDQLLPVHGPAGASEESAETAPARSPVKSNDLAYVIYTSGSTGQPKGVALEHQSAVAFVSWARTFFTPEELSGVLASTSICFDLSVFEIFVPLSCGGKILLAENALALPGLAAAQEVTLVNTVPSAMRELLRVKGVPSSVKVVNLAGEPLAPALVDRIYQETAVAKVFDLYGPTETTTYSTGGLRVRGAPASIGRPLTNEQVYVLDGQLQMAPIGVPGELFIGGAGLARGYLNRPELTRERFIPHPFKPGERLYKTGDLARWREDGTLEYLGRRDHQVKIRGFRIELGEVESVLKSCAAVRDAVVIAREDQPGDKKLVAYVAREGRSDSSEFRQILRQKLPEYMVPSAFVLLEKLPLTPNGKIDRKALPAPDQVEADTSSTFVAPRNPIEEQLATIWCEVLHLKKTGVHDNFFNLGGHSLLAIQVISRIREVFNVDLPLFCLFTAPTIAALAEGLAAGTWTANRKVQVPLQRRANRAAAPLSFVQERLWFLNQLEPESDAYHVPIALRLRGSLNIAALEQALNEILQRHEALRTTFETKDSTLFQVVAPRSNLRVSRMDLRNIPESEREARAQEWMGAQARAPFDLAHGPLIRAAVAALTETEHVLLVVMHHSVSDGWSLALFLQELAILYDRELSGKTVSALPELPVQYSDYACWQRQTMQGEALERELTYWKTHLAGAPALTDLPADHDAGHTAPRAARRTSIVPKKVVQKIADLGHQEGVTPFMLLMSALALTLYKWTGQTDLVVGTVVAGRNRRELENLIGCFMNFLPVRSRLDASETGKEFLAATRQTVLECQTHQDCPFEKIVEALNPERRLNRNPLYNVALLLQNFPSEMFASQYLEARRVLVPTDSPLLDLRFEAEQLPEGFSLTCEYRTDLFEESTIADLLCSCQAALEHLLSCPGARATDFRLTPGLEEQALKARARSARQTLAITATFTAEPVLQPLRFWVEKLGIPARIEFAPYGQVFQQLLDPGSLLGANQRGLNIVLLRLEDWLRGDAEKNGVEPSSLEQNLMRVTEEFVVALTATATRSAARWLVCVCPPSPSAVQNPSRVRVLSAAEEFLHTKLGSVNGVYLLGTRQIQHWYPVADYYDASGDELGHVPYNPLFFAALGTAIARMFHALNRPAYKVIAVDCDNTLWAGVCGEDGPQGIRIDSAQRALQEFLRGKHEAGMLLALCSKNNEADVNEVFAQRPEMPLRRDHFTAARLSWRPKSENLKALAEELRVGLQSFIFLDDNPVECAEVEANCPGVLALQLPEEPERIPSFLSHWWAFDQLKLTFEDRRRAELYRQEQQREQLRSASPSLMDFIDSLNLNVEIASVSPGQLTRVAQLAQRTNQFNTTTRRRTESEFQQLLLQHQVKTVSVRDRFGDYGLTGVMVYQFQGETLDVDSLLLSCRALGRGVEHRMLAHLGELALQHRLKWVGVHFVSSTRNKPALEFLEAIGSDFKQPLNGGYVYRFPADYAAKVGFHPQPANQFATGGKISQIGSLPDRELLSPSLDCSQTPDVIAAGGRPEQNEARFEIRPAPSSERTPRSRQESIERPLSQTSPINYRMIALELSDPGAIYERIEQSQSRQTARHAPYVAPNGPLETQFCELWAKLLHVGQVGVHDNFFKLGGHSLLAVRLFSELEKLTGRKLPLVTIFQAPTVRQLARALIQERSDVSGSLLVPIQPKGSKPPLFLVHGAGGDVLWGYANLAAYLPSDQPIVGIKSRGQIGLEECTTVPDMARCYVEAIRAHQKRGPYFLGGYCFGGNVAYEMARQLHEAHEEVALVVLIDTAPANAGYERMTWWHPGFLWRFSRNLREWLNDFAGLEPSVRRKFLSRKARTFGRKLKRRFLAPRAAATVDLEEVIDPGNFPENELRLWQIHLQALVQHTEGHYSGKVVLLRTHGQPLFCSLAEDFCWSKLVGTEVKVALIPGSHESIFMEPNVRTLAGELELALAETRRLPA